MALGLLWLGFTLLGALQTQARDPAPKLIPAPPLDRVPLQPDFKDDQVRDLEGELQREPGEEGKQSGREPKRLRNRVGQETQAQASAQCALLEAMSHAPISP